MAASFGNIQTWYTHDARPRMFAQHVRRVSAKVKVSVVDTKVSTKPSKVSSEGENISKKHEKKSKKLAESLSHAQNGNAYAESTISKEKLLEYPEVSPEEEKNTVTEDKNSLSPKAIEDFSTAAPSLTAEVKNENDESKPNLSNHELRMVIVESISSLLQESKKQFNLLGHASDEEVIHDLRVVLRRLRNALNIFSPFLGASMKQRSKGISRVLRILGPLRDADVMQETLDKIVADTPNLTPKEAIAVQKVRGKMMAERTANMAAVVQSLSGRTSKQALAGIERWLEAPKFRKSASEVTAVASQLVVPSILTLQASTLLLDQAWQIQDVEKKSRKIQTFDRRKSERMHALRKLLRELRYGMELLNQVYANQEKFPTAIKSVKELQSVLGDLQDLQVLTDFIEEHISKDLPEFKEAMTLKRVKTWENWLSSRGNVFSIDGQSTLYQALTKTKMPKEASSTSPTNDFFFGSV